MNSMSENWTPSRRPGRSCLLLRHSVKILDGGSLVKALDTFSSEDPRGRYPCDRLSATPSGRARPPSGEQATLWFLEGGYYRGAVSTDAEPLRERP